MLLVRYGKLQLAVAEGWEEEYHIKPVEKKARTQAKSVAEDVSTWDEENDDDDAVVVSEPVKKKPVAKTKAKTATPAKKIAAPAKKTTGKKAPVKKPTTKRKSEK